jgi:hypothetical protein
MRSLDAAATTYIANTVWVKVQQTMRAITEHVPSFQSSPLPSQPGLPTRLFLSRNGEPFPTILPNFFQRLQISGNTPCIVQMLDGLARYIGPVIPAGDLAARRVVDQLENQGSPGFFVRTIRVDTFARGVAQRGKDGHDPVALNLDT